MLCVPFSALTLMVSWQEGCPTRRNFRSVNPPKFSSTAGGGGREGELDDTDSPGKTDVKRKY